MATTSMTVVAMSRPALGKAPVLVVYGRGVEKRRRLTHEAEAALEILGHAIENVAGDTLYNGDPFRLTDPRAQAVLLLMERTRDIYLECPEEPTLRERLRTWLGFRAA